MQLNTMLPAHQVVFPDPVMEKTWGILLQVGYVILLLRMADAFLCSRYCLPMNVYMIAGIVLTDAAMMCPEFLLLLTRYVS